MSMSSTEEELRLKILKLQLEIEDLERKAHWQKRLGVFGSAGAILLPYVVLLFAICQFTVQQIWIQDSLNRQSEAQEKETDRAFMAPILARQAGYYFDAVTAAAKYASSSNESKRREAADQFLELYWGPLVILESPVTVTGMKMMKLCIDKGSRCSDSDRQLLSLYLGSALQKDYFNSARLDPTAFAARTFDYWHSSISKVNSVVGKLESNRSIPFLMLPIPK